MSQLDRELPDWLFARNYANPVYRAWKNMRQRCQNPKNPRYMDYGGRGIFVEASWENFEQFVKDMGQPGAGDTLERVDNNKGYDASNCQWASVREQNLKQRKRKDAPLGCKGVTKHSQNGLYYANARVHGKLKHLYAGVDYLEACCARKSWEAQHGYY